ncbi:MAG: hypothetical protein EXS55_01180 [Candidatus Magasanikbacteria bacterium]|nr:hypothetical protein [Candidatus Magasanikbacteria bacterium]
MAKIEHFTQPTSIQQTLIDLGLGENEAKLYEILLANPDATIPLLKQKSPFSRTMLYYILENLKGYGLLESKDIGPKTIFNASPPEKLEELFDDQEKELKRQKDQLKNVIGDLRSTYALAHNKPGIKFYEGKEGIIRAYEELLAVGQPIDSIEDKGEMATFIPEYFPKFIKQRVAKNIFNRVVAPSSNAINSTSEKELRETRTIPVEEFPCTMDIKIAGETVLMTTLKEDQAMAIQIHHPVIASNFKLLFKFFWDHTAKRESPNRGTAVAGDNSGVTMLNN